MLGQFGELRLTIQPMGHNSEWNGEEIWVEGNISFVVRKECFGANSQEAELRLCKTRGGRTMQIKGMYSEEEISNPPKKGGGDGESADMTPV